MKRWKPIGLLACACAIFAAGFLAGRSQTDVQPIIAPTPGIDSQQMLPPVVLAAYQEPWLAPAYAKDGTAQAVVQNEKAYTVVFVGSDTCAGCIQALPDNSRLAALYAQANIGFVYLWQSTIPDRTLDAHIIPLSLQNEVRVSASWPWYYILDGEGKVVLTTSNQALVQPWIEERIDKLDEQHIIKLLFDACEALNIQAIEDDSCWVMLSDPSSAQGLQAQWALKDQKGWNQRMFVILAQGASDQMTIVDSGMYATALRTTATPLYLQISRQGEILQQSTDAPFI